jgi:hypothetical protein
MNEELLIPGVPALSDEWIAQRTQHLLEEVATPSPRRKRGYVLTGVGGSALAITAALVGLLGPWATPAFAGWSAQPTTPVSGQLSVAESACATLAASLATSPGSTASATLPPLSLSDVRGPYSLLVYGTTDPVLCVLGNGFSSLHENGASIGMSSAAASPNGNSVVHPWSSQNVATIPSTSTYTPPAPGAVVVDINNTSDDNGTYFSVIEGSVGSQVSGATLLLSDGTSIVTTVENGLFAAWWPGPATVSSIQVTTTDGVN